MTSISMIARSFLSLSLDFSMLRQNQFSGENILKTFCEIPENWQHSGSHVAYVRARGENWHDCHRLLCSHNWNELSRVNVCKHSIKPILKSQWHSIQTNNNKTCCSTSNEMHIVLITAIAFSLNYADNDCIKFGFCVCV